MSSKIRCRFCESTRCDHGDHCADCGCPKCGYPGVRFVDPYTGIARGFCCDPDCDYEMVPGARKAWVAKQPRLTPFQALNEMRRLIGLPQYADDEVGQPILTEADWSAFGEAGQ